jgi:chromate transporter
VPIAPDAAVPLRTPRHPGSALEVFLIFLRLGVTSFGGPVAHLGYFRDAFVVRRRWFSERAYVDLVALCQFLPGPASSQVGMAIGLQRAGFLGMLAAWSAFTLPSAILLTAFAFVVDALGDVSGQGWLLGLKAAAVAVVAQAVLGMAKTLTPDAKRGTIAIGAMIAVLLIPSAFGQVAVIAAAALAGLLWLTAPPAALGDADAFPVRVPRGVAAACLVAFFALLALLPLLSAATASPGIRLADVFYRAGALVFGGGHVVLPLLESGTVQTGLVSHDDFLAGYGAAQAVPGPLFTFSAFLGAVTSSGPSGVAGAAIALVAIFLPAGLLITGALPFWDALRAAPRVRRALMGVNAGVVGILGAALYTPVFTEGIGSVRALALALAAFLALAIWKSPPWAVVVTAGLIGFLVL